MNLTRPITTIEEMTDFFMDLRLLLGIESEMAEGYPSQKLSTVIDEVESLNERLTTLLAPASLSTTDEGLFLPFDTQFSPEVKEVLSQIQKVIKNAEFKGLEILAIIKPDRLPGEGYQSPDGFHRHECPNCGTIWEHSDAWWDIDKTHHCPTCSREQLYKYNGPKSPNMRA